MPHTTPIPDLLEKLAADPTSGLPLKEAARRLEASSAAPLFRKAPRPYAACVRQTVREPALWLLVAVAVISLFFDRVALGLFCLLLTLGNTALCAYFLYRADRTDAIMGIYDTPLCRVLRGGRILRIPADGLVTGDIILIDPGDVIPADCRLLRTDRFSVLERELDASVTRRPPVLLAKDADGFPDASEGLRVSPVNMVFAGGMAETGTALAVVVAVGSDTHLGGLIGQIPSAHSGRSVGYFKKAAGFLSVYNLCLLSLMLPLTALGIFTVGDHYEFLDIFLSALALASLTLTEHLMARGIHLASETRRDAAIDRDGANTAEIKSAAAAETMTAMTDLLLVGTAALHDGACHPETLRVGERVYHCDRPETDEEAQAVAEYLFLYREGLAALPASGHETDGYRDLLASFCSWAEVDTEGLRVRIKEIRPRGQGVSGILPVPSGNRRVTVSLTRHFDVAEGCSGIYECGVSRPLDSERKNALYRVYREAVRQGSIPLFVLVESDGETLLRAMLTYTAHVSRKTAGCIKNLESAGIRVAAFLRDTADTNPRVLDACGLTEVLPADRPAPDGMPRTPAAERMKNGCRAFEGCTTEYIAACIADLKAEGRTVGVLSAEGDDVTLLADADVAFTCAPSLYAAAETEDFGSTFRDFEGSAGEDGRPDSRVANDRSRRTAHAVVRRSSATGGGVLGVLRALQASDHFRDALTRTLRYLLLSQTVRMVMTVLPLCLGLAVASAPALLVSGLLADLLVMTAYLNLPAGATPAPRRAPDADVVPSPRAYLPEMIAAAVGSVLPWIVAGIAVLCGVEFGGDLLYYGMLCTAGLQLVLFRADRLPRRDSTVFFGTLALVFIYVGCLAAALVGGLAPLWALCMPLTAPVGYVLARALGLGVTKMRREKKSDR